MVNAIIRLKWPHLIVPFTKTYKIKITGYCYHSGNVITFGVAQGDYIKRLLLYIPNGLTKQWNYLSQQMKKC